MHFCHKCNACSSKKILGPQSLGPSSPWVLYSPLSHCLQLKMRTFFWSQDHLCTTSRATILLMHHSVYCLLAQLHCKNNLVVLTRVVTMVADKLKKRSSWKRYFGQSNCIRKPKGQLPNSSYNHNTLKTFMILSSGYMKVPYCNFELHL